MKAVIRMEVEDQLGRIHVKTGRCYWPATRICQVPYFITSRLILSIASILLQYSRHHWEVARSLDAGVTDGKCPGVERVR